MARLSRVFAGSVPAAQRAGQADEAFQSGGGVGGHLEEVRGGAELRLDGGEQVLRLAGGGGGIEGRMRLEEWSTGAPFAFRFGAGRRFIAAR